MAELVLILAATSTAHAKALAEGISAKAKLLGAGVITNDVFIPMSGSS